MLTLLTIVCTVGGYAQETVTDELTATILKVSTNGYNKFATKTLSSGASYDGAAYANGTKIQIKAKKDTKGFYTGIITSASSGTIKSITINFNSANSNTLGIYGKNTAYTTADDLFGSAAGELIKNVDNSKTAVTITPDKAYKFIGFKSNNGTVYIDKITIVWEKAATTTTTFGANSGKTFTFTNGTLDGFTTPTATATKSDDNTDLSNLIEYTSTDAGIVTVDSKTGELTFTNTKFGKATITATLPKTDTYQTSTDSYAVENKDNHIPTSLSFNGTDVTLTEGKTDAGTDFTGYTATEANNIEGTITYAASGDAVATVNETTGAVTVSPSVYGTTTITATFTPADLTQYSGSTATYKITNKKAVDLSEITFDVSEDKSNNSSQQIADNLNKSIVKIYSTKAILGNGTDYRFYKDSKTTFSLTDPTRVITSIKFIHSNTTGPNFTTDKNTYDKASGTWTGYEESVTFTNPGSVIRNITQIIVTTAEKKPAPALSFAEATVTKELKEETIEVQALTKPEDLDVSAITYASSDNETAEVYEGQILMYKTGEVIITATSAATDKYVAGTASYKLVISDSRKDAALAVKETLVKVKLGDEPYNLASNITCDNGLNSDTFKYTSSDNGYTITDNLIKFDKVGTTTITAKFDGNDSYKPAEVSYTFEVEGPRTTDADFKFAAESYSADLATDGIVTFNAADVLQNPNSLNVTYTISPKDEDVEIDASTGYIMISKRGIYTITAIGAANNTYKETEAKCTLKVFDSTKQDETFTFIAGLHKGTQTGNSKEDQIVQDVVTIHGTNAAFAAITGTEYTYRLYQNSSTTISTKVGKITKIEFIGSNNSSSNYSLKKLTSMTDNNYTCTDHNYGVWEGSAKEVKFKAVAQVRVIQIIVTILIPKEYTINETKKDNVIEDCAYANVTLQRTLSKDYWNTFCVPFALDAEQVTQYFGEGTQLRTYEGNCNDNIVYFTTVENIEAGKPYIMKPGNAVVQNPTFEGVSMVATGLDEKGNPQAVGDASTVQMKGIYNQILLKTDKTELFLGDNDLFYYPIDNVDARTIGGLRAYFIVPQGTDIKKLRANLDGTPTSLDTIFDTEESNAPVYNLQGQCVGNSLRALKSGIYIQNGKKVVVK